MHQQPSWWLQIARRWAGGKLFSDGWLLASKWNLPTQLPHTICASHKCSWTSAGTNSMQYRFYVWHAQEQVNCLFHWFSLQLSTKCWQNSEKITALFIFSFPVSLQNVILSSHQTISTEVVFLIAAMFPTQQWSVWACRLMLLPALRQEFASTGGTTLNYVVSNPSVFHC